MRSADSASRGSFRPRSSIADRRLHALLASSFGALGFIVALSGLAAALSRTVLARRQEIAIRIALGASRRQAMELVMRHAVTLVAIGVAVGLLIAAAAGRGLAAHLFGVTAYDPLTYVAVALATTLVALLASAVPAYSATRLDPNELLRAE